MGVHYFPCKRCKVTLNDCSSSYSSFFIQGVGSWSVCTDCTPIMRGLLTLNKEEEPDWTYFILPQDSSKEGSIHANWNSCKRIAALLEAGSYRVGLVKKRLEYLKPRLQDALLRRNGCGGMSDADVYQLCETMRKGEDFYVGWRGHNAKERYYNSDCLCIPRGYRDCNLDSADVLLEMERYRKKHKIPEGTPFLVTRDSASSPECDSSDISFFARPEQHHDTCMADSVEELEESRWLALDPSEVTWLPTPAFVQELLEKQDKKRRRCEEKMESLKKLCVE